MKRGELEITDFLTLINKNKNLNYKKIGRGYSWNDVGTFESLIECANLIYNIEKKQGLEISSPDEVAYRKKMITKEKYIIFSKGHKNPQSVTKVEDKFIAVEHGPQGGDELNVIKKNNNYHKSQINRL